MAQTLPKMVKAKSGVEYDAASPQGQMIVNAAKPAFTPESKALGSISNSLTTISTNVVSIGESVAAMVMIAQADARGDALNKSNVVQDDLGGASELTSGQMRDRGEGGGDDGGLGGLMGIGALVGGFGKGLSFWGTPLAIAGALSFTVFLGGLIGLAYVGARTFNASSGEIAEGMETLSNADVDTDKVILMGEALAKFGLAMGAEGLGAGIGSLGNLVSGIADGFAGFLGIEKKDPMVALKAFAQHDITEDEVKQIELNARALTVFSGAMAVSAGADFITSIANLASGVVNFVTNFFPEKEDPMLKMIEFASHKIDQGQVDQIKLNAAALVGFSTVMATVKAIGVVEDIADLASGIVNFASSFFPKGKDPMLEMKKFAGTKITQAEADQIVLNSKALIAFAPTMAIAKATGAAADIASMFGGIANAVGSFFGFDDKDPMAEMKLFAETKITQQEADQISLNASALVNFSKAMALYSAGGAAADALDLVGSMAKGITNFFGGTTGIDYEEIKTFAASDIGTLEPKITANAKALGAFSLAMQNAASDSAGVEWTNIGANILGAVGSIFGGKAEDKIDYEDVKTFAALGFDETTEANIEQNAKSIHAFTSAVAKMSSLKQGKGFWSSIGNTLSGAFSALMGQDTLPIDEIIEFTKTKLDLATVNNNISAIEAFMNFGTKMKGFDGFGKGFGDFGKNITKAAQGIYIALYGGKNTIDENYKLKPSNSLTQIDLNDFARVSAGIDLLTSSLGLSRPTQQLKAVSAEMDASTGATTIIYQDSSIKSSSATTTTSELEAISRDSASQLFMNTQGQVALGD